MPVSEKYASLLAREDEALERLRARRAVIARVLEALPPDCPVPAVVEDFGYCASAYLRFDTLDDESLRYVLTTLKPLPLVFVESHTWSQKPATYVRAEEKRTGKVTELYPVLIRQEQDATRKSRARPRRLGKGNGPLSRARWWTHLAQLDVMVETILQPGQDVRIAVPAAVRAELSPGLYDYGAGSVQYYQYVYPE